jgi:hypothetical protein
MDECRDGAERDSGADSSHSQVIAMHSTEFDLAGSSQIEHLGAEDFQLLEQLIRPRLVVVDHWAYSEKTSAF